MGKFIFLILSSFVVFGITIFFRLGGHKDVSVVFRDYPEMHLLYKKHQGPYHKINSVIVEVEIEAAKSNYNCAITFGEYIDDPRETDERFLKSHGGCLVSSEPELLPAGLEYKNVESRKWVVAEFSGAPSISPMKVYPKVEEYLQAHSLKKNGPVFELYHQGSRNHMKTEYLFYVDHAK